MDSIMQKVLKQRLPQGSLIAPITYLAIVNKHRFLQMANYEPSSQEEDGYSHRQLGQVNRRGRGLKRPQGASFYEDNGPYRGFNDGGQQGIPNGGYYGPKPPPPPPLMGLPPSSENALVAENEKLRRDLKRSAARENIAAQTLSAYSLLVSKGLEVPPQYILTLNSNEDKAKDVLVTCWKQALAAEVTTDASFMGKIIAAVNLLSAGFDGIVQSGLRLQQPVAAFFTDGTASRLLGGLHNKLSEPELDELSALMAILILNMAQFLGAPIPANSLSPAPVAGISYAQSMIKGCGNPACRAETPKSSPAVPLTLTATIKYLRETAEKLQATLPAPAAVAPPPAAVEVELVEDAFID